MISQFNIPELKKSVRIKSIPFCAEFVPQLMKEGKIMLRIDLCDDEQKERNEILALLETYLRTYSAIPGQVKTF